MTNEVTMTNETNEVVREVPKYIKQRAARKRYSFGPAWLNAVLGGVVNDKDKLIAHAVKLKVGAKSDVSKLKFETLLEKVQNAIYAGDTAGSEDTASNG